MFILFVKCVVSGLFGWHLSDFFHKLGYNVATKEFWFVCMPLSSVVGFVIGGI